MEGRKRTIAPFNSRHGSQQVCRFFNQPTGCRFGPHCKFLHVSNTASIPPRDGGPIQNHSSTNARSTGNASQGDNDGFQKWRYSVPLDRNRAQPLGLRMPSFLLTALHLINSDTGVMQQVITSLTSEGGFIRIKEILDRNFDTLSDKDRRQFVSSEIVPLFKIITHPDVVASIMLEEKLSSIYTFLYGRQGERGVNVFTLVVNVFTSTEQPDVRHIDTLEPVLAVFSNMVDINTHALGNEALPSLAEVLLQVSNNIDDATSLHLRRLMTKIRQRLGVGHAIELRKDRSTSSQLNAVFMLPRDGPGLLSPHGPRHDNDHADIKQIQILPTSAEIRASRSPYLPSSDPAQSHLPGVQGLLDRHFRLLREDTVGQLRDAVRAEIDQGVVTKSAARIYTYNHLVVMGPSFSRWKGFQLKVRVNQPQRLRQSTLSKRKEWWEHTNRLRPDALVCILDQDQPIGFCTVSALSHSSDPKSNTTVVDRDGHLNMYSNKDHCYLTLQPIKPDLIKISAIARLFQVQNPRQRLVEFPGVLLPSFQPTLEALQQMSKSKDLPFADILAPEEDDTVPRDCLDPPLYATQHNFEFELKDIMKDKSSLKFSNLREFDIENFKAKTQLDDTQADALLNCLVRSLALIQGPPGTGKSFTGIALIKVLLAIRKQASLGPILCVCYTNHALDQLLEHLHGHGVTQIIRMGSRSKSEVLESCNLRSVTQNMPMTGVEKKERWETMQALESEEREINDVLKMMSDPTAEQNVANYLLANHPHHHHELFFDDSHTDEEGWETVHRSGSTKLQSWLRDDSAHIYQSQHVRPVEILQACPVFRMNIKERRALYDHWLADMQEDFPNRLFMAMESHEAKKAQVDRIRNGQELRCLEAANVIGVTTTGLARQLDLLRKLRSKVLVCEEAGEVLEAHILTALLPSLEHVILIGDHLQLSPHIQNFDLSRSNPRGNQYSLDTSLFERLVAPENSQAALPFSTLQTQRRMHPSISALIKSTLYPQLVDSPHVESYPGVVGMKKRLFWFDHQHLEAGADPNELATTSHTNDYELRMVVSLVIHLVRQGTYGANDIAVLTPYLGQLHNIRKALRNQFEITMNERDLEDMERQGIVDDNDHQISPRSAPQKTALLKTLAVSTIDNFQGEEAKVVLISLVRSNPQNKCGFLKTSNRINVLLSRAKHGMYIIGNSRTSSHVDMWANVIRLLRENNNFGSQFELECPRHSEVPIVVSNPDDFDIFSPEGGCGKMCDKRLSCGHRCLAKCHSESLHNAIQCLEECPRQLKGCDHQCPNKCGEQCINQCKVKLTDLAVELDCGHIKDTLTCWQQQHPSSVRCDEPTKKTIPGCGHQLTMACCVNNTSNDFRCEAPCGAVLECGHVCQKPCNKCNVRLDGEIVLRDHKSCQQVCERKFNSCSHYCKAECHGDTPCQCKSPCDNFCEHSRCGKQCNEPCAPCAEAVCVGGQCPHSAVGCKMPCSAPCDWLPCAKRCEKMLPCGHQCPTVCGEICPSEAYCQFCANQDMKDTPIDFIEGLTFAEVDLSKDPCVVPACGHVLTISSMDGQMAMSEHYEMEENVVTGIKDDSVPFSMDKLKVCATCRGPLRNIARYGRIVRRALLDQSTKKFVQWAGLRTIALTQALHNAQEQLQNSLEDAQAQQQKNERVIKILDSRSQQLSTMTKEGGKRYKAITKVRNQISVHLHKVQIEEQPYRRVWDLVQHAKRFDSNTGHMSFDTTVLQTRQAVQTTALLLRSDLTILSDFFASFPKVDFKVNLAENRADCEELIIMALERDQPVHVVEGHMFFAQYCAAERSYMKVDEVDALMTDARDHITQARSLCQQKPGPTRNVVNELDVVEKMLRESTFYAPMRDEEWRAIMKAMANDFRGTGHWYTCENGHPFTVGECGMPMQEARCPQCDAPIGGRNHAAAAGVRHARDLEQRFGNMEL